MSNKMKVYVVVFTEQTRESNDIELYATTDENDIDNLIKELSAQVNTDEYTLVENENTYKKYVDCHNENCVIIYSEEIEVRK